MKTTEALKTRKSVRKFTGKVIDQNVLKELFEAAK